MDGAKVHMAVANAAKAMEQVTAVDKLRESGVTIHGSTPTEKDLFRRASQQAVIDCIATQTSKDLVDNMLKAVEDSKKKVHQDKSFRNVAAAIPSRGEGSPRQTGRSRMRRPAKSGRCADGPMQTCHRRAKRKTRKPPSKA